MGCGEEWIGNLIKEHLSDAEQWEKLDTILLLLAGRKYVYFKPFQSFMEAILECKLYLESKLYIFTNFNIIFKPKLY